MGKNIQLLYTDLKGAGVVQFYGKGKEELRRLERKLAWLASRKLVAQVEVDGKVVGYVYQKLPSYGWIFDPDIFNL